MKRKITLLIVVAILFSKIVTAQIYSLEWKTAFAGIGGSWIAGETIGTASNVGGSGIDITAKFVNSRPTAYMMGSPGVDSTYTLPGSTGKYPMLLHTDWDDTNQNITGTITFSSPVVDPSFYVGDIDKNSTGGGFNNNYIDRVVVTGSTPSGTTIDATATKFNVTSDVVAVSGNVAQANSVVGQGGNAATNSPTGAAQDGTVLFNIAGTVSSITLVYSNGNAGVIFNTTAQGVVLGNITFSKPASILPIKQENFTAAKQGEAVILSWMVGDEADVAGYEVEFSINAINFASINYVSALNMGKYNFLHTTPVTGLNFYRLKIRDRDGNYTYSNIAKVNFTKRNAILLYPNPAKDALNMTMANNMVNRPALINIFSMDGKLILTRSIKALSRTELLDISKIATGKYIVQTIVDGDIINNSIEVIR